MTDVKPRIGCYESLTTAHRTYWRTVQDGRHVAVCVTCETDTSDLDPCASTGPWRVGAYGILSVHASRGEAKRAAYLHADPARGAALADADTRP